MNSGEIPVRCLDRAQRRPETVAAHLRIETAAQFLVINEKMGSVEPKRRVRHLVQFWKAGSHVLAHGCDAKSNARANCPEAEPWLLRVNSSHNVSTW